MPSCSCRPRARMPTGAGLLLATLWDHVTGASLRGNAHCKRQRTKMDRNQCGAHISNLLLDRTSSDQTMLGGSYVSQWMPFMV